MDFAVQPDNRVKIKENKKKKLHVLETCKRNKKLLNTKETVIPIVIGALGTVTKDLVKGREELEIGGRLTPSKLQHSKYWPEY